MTKRRSKGDGGLHWDESRQRWIATATIGYRPNGRRIVKKSSGKTKTEAKEKLKAVIRDLDDGLPVTTGSYTVADAATNWLAFGLNGRDIETVKNYTILTNTHIVPLLGKRQLRELTADDVDKWLAGRAIEVSTRTVRLLHSLLSRSVKHAQARDKVKRNVVALCEIPQGLEGRPSKSFTFDQAEAILKASEQSPLHAYVVLSLLIGARTEELRALRWDHVDLHGEPGSNPPVLRSINVWRSVRKTGDTKTSKSRRTLAMPTRCAVALRLHRLRQKKLKEGTRQKWHEHGLVFTSATGTGLDASNVRKMFHKIVKDAGIQGEWTPRELRHSFVSLLSSSGVRIEDIARLCGHSGTAVTEKVYRHQIRPVMMEAAIAMNDIFSDSNKKS